MRTQVYSLACLIMVGVLVYLDPSYAPPLNKPAVECPIIWVSRTEHDAEMQVAIEHEHELADIAKSQLMIGIVMDPVPWERTMWEQIVAINHRRWTDYRPECAFLLNKD